MLKCCIVQDLTPGYTDGLLSGESDADAEVHLDECAGCRSDYEKMKSEITADEIKIEDRSADFLKKARKKSVFTAVLLFVIGIITSAAGVYIGGNR